MARPMDERNVSDLTQQLNRMCHGDSAAAAASMDVLYPSLVRIARRRMSRERVDHTLGPADLVHEAWMKVVYGRPLNWYSRRAFLAASGRAMEHVLRDYAKRRACAKRGGGQVRVPYEAAFAVPSTREGTLAATDVADLAQAMDELSALDPDAAEVLHARTHLGLTGAESAEHLGVSRGTVVNRLRRGEAWLSRHLADR